MSVMEDYWKNRALLNERTLLGLMNENADLRKTISILLNISDSCDIELEEAKVVLSNVDVLIALYYEYGLLMGKVNT